MRDPDLARDRDVGGWFFDSQ
jgi:hypothetical protein